jgi:ABC-type uncharacterized transport system substrate-binding protein
MMLMFVLTQAESVTGRTSDNEEVSLNNGQKWKIAYCGMNKSSNHVSNMQAIINGLESSGWLTTRDKREGVYPTIKQGDWNNEPLWKYLSDKSASEYIDFDKDAYFFPTEEEMKDLDAFTRKVIDTINKRGDIDLLIVMGTKAGECLTDKGLNTKMMVLSTNNAVTSGIVDGIKDSGKDKVWAHMYPDRFKNQLRVFYDTFKFEKLGIVYEDTPTGRVIGAVDDINEAAKEKGFEVIAKNVVDKDEDTDITDYKQKSFYKETLKAYEELAQQVDAVYISLYNSRTYNMVESLMQPFYEKGIPVFSSHGINVQYGMLMSVTDMSDPGLGSFYASAIQRALQEDSLRNIDQVYNTPPKIIINMEAAKKTNYKIPFEVLLVADEVHTKISRPEN